MAFWREGTFDLKLTALDDLLFESVDACFCLGAYFRPETCPLEYA